METETNCRNNTCYHFLVRRERVGYGSNQYFCNAGIAKPQRSCQQLNPVVVSLDAARRARRG